MIARDTQSASFYGSLSQVQLLAAPNSDGMPGAPRWSALVMGGVAIPYEKVVGIRVVESAHEFIVEHRLPQILSTYSATPTRTLAPPLNLTRTLPLPPSPHTPTL